MEHHGGSIQTIRKSLSILLLFVSTAAFGQLWSGVIDPVRAIDWSGAGATMPARTQCGSTVAAYGSSGSPASASTINSAFVGCAANTYVLLGAGTFFLNSTITPGTSGSGPVANVTLRGSGSNTTFLIFSGTGGTLYNGFCAGFNICGASTSTNVPSSPDHTATWSAGYTQGTTSITLSSTTGLSIGSTMILDQIDNQSDPGAGSVYAGCEQPDSSAACYSGTGPNSFERGQASLTTIRGQQQMVKVTSISGGTVGISPGLYAPNWNQGAGRSPGAWWASATENGFGVESMSIQPNVGSAGTIYLFNCSNCWVKGVRGNLQTSPSGSGWGHVIMQNCAHCTVRDSYFYGNVNVDNYVVAVEVASDILVENNIMQFPGTTQFYNSDCEGCVADYNFGINALFSSSSNWLAQSSDYHGIDLYSLAEGNISTGLYADSFHGNHSFNTQFRNRWDGHEQNNGSTTSSDTTALLLLPGTRFNNAIGNILGTVGYHTIYKATSSSHTNIDLSVIGAGWYGAGGIGDALTNSTSMFWGNWDNVTNTTRWCGNSGNTGWSTTCASASEVPTGAATYPNAVPASQTLPASFIYSSRPAWWPASKAWPAIGPDVTGGTVGQCVGGTMATSQANNSSQCTGGTLTATGGGMVTSTPAMDCALNTMGIVANGTGAVKPFDSAACYATTPTVAQPTASPVAGTYAGPTPVALSTTTPSATICYTLDGTTPTTNGAGTCTHGTTYSGTFTLTLGSTTVKAIGSLSGDLDSSILTAAYTITPNTFYIRPDGGTRWTPAHSTGQCNGKFDVSYASTGGTGVNKNCAFNDPRWLWDDQTFGNYPNWAISGGDTVILRANTAGAPWRVGFQGDGSSTDPWCFGGSGPFGCGMPGIPSGISSQHTRFLGENFGACSTTRTIMTVSGPRVQAIPDVSKTTKIFGGHGVFTVVNDVASQYVDVQCLDISSFTPACQLQGSPNSNPCHSSIPLSDYVSDGLVTSNTSGNLLIQDIYLHGTNSRGIHGQQGTGPVLGNRIWISITPQTGWDFDNGTTSGTGDWTMTNSIIECSGCQQKNSPPNYPPLSDAQLWQNVNNAFSQGTGAVIGDGIGTPPNSGFNVTMDSNVFQWNTQDGEDFGHMDTGSFTFTLTNNVSQHNMGQTFKNGWAFSTVTWLNNISIADCARMVAGNQLPGGVSSTLNQYLVDGCRAGDNYSINFQHATNMLTANNTIVGYQPTFFDYKCVDGSNDCSASTWNINNNIVMAYNNPAVNSGISPADFCGPSCNGPPFTTIGTINRKNNLYFNLRACHANVLTPDAASGTSTGEACVSPQFVSQPASPMASFSSLDGFNFNITGTSPAIAGGVTYAGILANDYAGNAKTTPPVIGALNNTGTTTVATPIFTPGAGTYTVTQTPVGSVSTIGAVIGYTTDGSTPTATTPGTVDHGTTLFTNLQDPAGGGTWTQCAGTTCAGGTNTGSGSISFNNSTPIGTNSIIQTSNGNGFNTMYFRHLGCPGGSCTAVTGMTEDQDFYIPSSTTHLQALEFDPDLFDGSFEYFASVQCDSVSGKWRFWNMAAGTWVPSAFSCSILTATNTNHHMHLETVFNTTAHTYGISKMVVDGATICTSCSSYSALANAGTATVNIEQQIDNDSTAVSNVVYYSNLSLLMSATPLTIPSTTTVKAIGTLAGDTNSGVGSYTYTITPPPTSTGVTLGGRFNIGNLRINQ